MKGLLLLILITLSACDQLPKFGWQQVDRNGDRFDKMFPSYFACQHNLNSANATWEKMTERHLDLECKLVVY